MTAYRAPRPLAPTDQIDEFTCQSSEQTNWLRRHSRQSLAMSSTRVFVVPRPDAEEVVAYYAWAMAHLDIEAAPPRLQEGAGRYPQPVALLARLGVDVDHEGRGLGAGLVADVIRRLIDLNDEIGCRGLLIHCETADARAFYLHLIPELMPSPTDDLHLVLLMKDARRTILG